MQSQLPYRPATKPTSEPATVAVEGVTKEAQDLLQTTTEEDDFAFMEAELGLGTGLDGSIKQAGPSSVIGPRPGAFEDTNSVDHAQIDLSTLTMQRFSTKIDLKISYKYLNTVGDAGAGKLLNINDVYTIDAFFGATLATGLVGTALRDLSIIDIHNIVFSVAGEDASVALPGPMANMQSVTWTLVPTFSRTIMECLYAEFLDHLRAVAQAKGEKTCQEMDARAKEIRSLNKGLSRYRADGAERSIEEQRHCVVHVHGQVTITIK